MIQSLGIRGPPPSAAFALRSSLWKSRRFTITWKATARTHLKLQVDFATFTDFALDTEHYLEHIRKVKERVSIPLLVRSMAPRMAAGSYSRLIEQAGADALELNF